MTSQSSSVSVIRWTFLYMNTLPNNKYCFCLWNTSNEFFPTYVIDVSSTGNCKVHYYVKEQKNYWQRKVCSTIVLLMSNYEELLNITQGKAGFK